MQRRTPPAATVAVQRALDAIPGKPTLEDIEKVLAAMPEAERVHLITRCALRVPSKTK